MMKHFAYIILHYFCMTTNRFNLTLIMEEYAPLVWSFVRQMVNDLIDHAVALAEWKKKRFTSSPHYGTGEFPLDSGSPLSTFSSNSNASVPTSPETPTFEQLKGKGNSNEVLEPPTFKQLEGICNKEKTWQMPLHLQIRALLIIYLVT